MNEKTITKDDLITRERLEANGWNITSETKPAVESSVEITDDLIEIGTADYISQRTCMLAGCGGGNGYFGVGFATDGSTGCERGLILDEPKYWRYY